MSEVNLDRSEQQKFEQVADSWWDPHGPFRPLHELNPARLKYVADRCHLAGSAVLDVGCGGGILAESLAREGAIVTAIDIAEQVLEVARLHQLESGVELTYRNMTAEQLAAESPAAFDVVTCMEMLEHVPDPGSVVGAVARLLKPGGQAFFSTINRSLQAFAAAIVGAEYVLRLLPRGTHRYDRFIRPSELSDWVRQAGMTVCDIRGIHYQPLTHHVRVGRGVEVNYLLHAARDTS